MLRCSLTYILSSSSRLFVSAEKVLLSRLTTSSSSSSSLKPKKGDSYAPITPHTHTHLTLYHSLSICPCSSEVLQGHQPTTSLELKWVSLQQPQGIGGASHINAHAHMHHTSPTESFSSSVSFFPKASPTALYADRQHHTRACESSTSYTAHIHHKRRCQHTYT